jgi:DNA-binding Xre family transcriptional regulator
MANRSREYSVDLAKKLKKKSYRQEFFLALIEEEGLSVREAIYVIAKTMGNQEFSHLIGMEPSNTTRIVNPVNDIRSTTLEHILTALGLELSVKVA